MMWGKYIFFLKSCTNFKHAISNYGRMETRTQRYILGLIFVKHL